MNGIINVYKPIGMTSFDIVKRIKKISGVKKVGHTGTLDPLASGVLPVCIGKATKVVDYIMNKTKVYKTQLKLGIISDTYDREGNILEKKIINTDNKKIINVINSFQGNIEQIPPMYSAIKVNGKRLYELARAGIEIERNPRKIIIYNIDIIDINLPYIDIQVKCSKGTYIRSLCHDIGEKLQCGAVMWNLERIASGDFNKKNSIIIDNLTKDNIKEHLISIEEIFKKYPKLNLNSKFSKLAVNGVKIKDHFLLKYIDYDIFYRVYNSSNVFIGLGKKDINGFKINKLFI